MQTSLFPFLRFVTTFTITITSLLTLLQCPTAESAIPIGQIIKVSAHELSQHLAAILGPQKFTDREISLVQESLELAFRPLPPTPSLSRADLQQRSILDGRSLDVNTLRQIAKKPADQVSSDELVDLVNLSAAVIKRHPLRPTPNILLSRGQITQKMADLGMAHLLTPTDQQAAVYLRAAPFASTVKKRKILLLGANYLPHLQGALKNVPNLMLDNYYLFWRKLQEGTTQERMLAKLLLPLALSDRQKEVNFLAYELFGRDLEKLDQLLLDDLVTYLEQFSWYRGLELEMPHHRIDLLSLASEMDDPVLQEKLHQLLQQ